MNTVRFFSLALLFLLIAPVPGSAAELSPEARQVLHHSRKLMDRKDYAQAAAVLQTYMDKAGEAAPPQVWTYLGGALYESGDVDKAARIFCNGHEVYPDNSLLCLNAGNTLYELERFAEAAPLLEKAYGLQQPAKPEWLYQAGAAYYQGKTFGESARVLQRLLKSTATPRKEWIRLAIHALLESGRAPEAENLLLNYLAISPQEADYWRLLAKLYMEREQYDRAGAALEICYRLAPPSLNDMEQLASLYNYRNAPLLAASTLKTAYGQSPSREQTLRVAALLASAGRTSQAVDYLDTYLGAGQGALEKGKYLYGARRFEQAESEFRKLLSLEDQPEARFYLALCAWERTDWKAARRELERIAELKAFRAKTSSYLTVLADLDRADAVPLQ